MGEETEDREPFHEGRPPENEVPATVPFDAQLFSTGDFALFVAGLRVYSTGIELRLELRARTSQDGLFDAFHRGGPEGILIGIEFADGRRGSNAGWYRDPGAGGGGGVTVFPGGGGGGDRSVDTDYFVAPLPPAGPLRIICAWPKHDITDHVTELPGEQIAAAAARVQQLWPRQPRSQEPRIPDPPAVSPDSWFAG
ncbi:MAG TPA: hypothetical protein VGE43_01790 [Acidimicrobiales bacterium]